jgi:hypothetical protein
MGKLMPQDVVQQEMGVGKLFEWALPHFTATVVMVLERAEGAG